MPARLWQLLMVALAALALIVTFVDVLTVDRVGDDHLSVMPYTDGASFRVIGIDGAPGERGAIRIGDLIRYADPHPSARQRFSDLPIGTTEHWLVRRGAQQFAATSTLHPLRLDQLLIIQTFNAIRLAMLAVGLLVAIRRPDAADARALSLFLVATGASLLGTPPVWLADGLLVPYAALRTALLQIGIGSALRFACLFPQSSASGVRAWLLRFSTPAFATIALLSAAHVWIVYISAPIPPAVVAAGTAIRYTPYLVLSAMTIAFTIGARNARGAARQRALWAAGSIAIGFSGVIVSETAQFVFGATSVWLSALSLTLVAIPIGLAYTILRHRTIDIGFVISRALVLTTISLLIVAAFGLVERALGKLFIDMSHIASRSVEIALALGLGFSLRSLHVRVERGVDYLFFRGRQRSLSALRAFARDVDHIGDPNTVVRRTIAAIETHAGAAAADVRHGDEIAGDDPLFVRLRASREAVSVRDTGTSIAGESAFPMFVRGTLTGALVVAAKTNGDVYDPEERALIATIAERAGYALDALRTLAVQRELEALRAQLTPVAPPLLGEGAAATGGAASAL